MTNDKVLKLAKKYLLQIIDDAYIERGDWKPAVLSFAAAIEAECSKELAAAQGKIELLLGVAYNVEKCCCQMDEQDNIVSPCFAHIAYKDEAIAKAIEPYKQDAERYRWLRVNSTQPQESWSTHSNPESLDVVIDKAIRDRTPYESKESIRKEE
jgi:hypothetical protein